VPFAGMTDRAIIRAGLRVIGAADDDAAIDALLEAYLPELADEMPRATGYVVHPGIAELVDVLAGRGAAVGLGTGNIREGARLKLERGDLWRRFPFGGFGCDHEDRPTLLRIGRDRGAARLGVAPESCRTVVIGDTLRDIVAARALGAACIAVGTGGDALDVLAAAGPDAVFADLTAPGALAAVLGEAG
jgi:phosphoglycolate phosphatase-like HAD superfamily hydrolase